MCDINFPDLYNTVGLVTRNSSMGQCARCGGSLVYDHVCFDKYAVERVKLATEAHEQTKNSTLRFGAVIK